MKTRIIVYALLAGTALSLRAADNLSTLLQKGLFEEEANHNFNAAIQAYQAVAERHDEERKLVATAIFRLGECYRKLGKTNEAAAYYERVLRDFSDQPRLVELSRQAFPRPRALTMPDTLGGLAPAREPSARVMALNSQLVETQTELRRMSALLDQLSKMSAKEQRRALPTVMPDNLLERLLEQEQKNQVRLTELEQSRSREHPEVVGALAAMKQLDQQVAERIEGIVAGLKARVAALKLQADEISRDLASAQAERGAAAPVMSPSVRQEQKRLLEEEIKLVETQLASVKRMVENGRAPHDDILGKEREILALKRQLVLLNDVVASPPAKSTAAAAPTDEEEKEVRRIQALIKDSPDLINAGPPSSLSLLHQAASRGQLMVASFLLTNKAEVNARNASDTTPLHTAVLGGHKTMVELLLAHGADVNAQDGANSRGTALHLAVNGGYKAVVEVLLAHKANPNVRNSSGTYPLHMAAARAYKAIAELLLAQGAEVNSKADSGSTPLHAAASPGNTAIAELLLAKGAQVDAQDKSENTPLHLAAERGHLSLVSLLLSNGAAVNLKARNGDTALHRAIRSSKEPQYTPVVDALLKASAEPNLRSADGLTPLMLAALREGQEIVDLLLKAKADPNLASVSGGSQGWTALHMAISERNRAVVALLLKAGAAPNSAIGTSYRNSGSIRYTPLLMATLDNNTEIVRLLLEAKADPNLADSLGWTPLLLAAGNDLVEIAELLLKQGAQPDVMNLDNRTPLTAAATRDSKAMVALLLQHEANPNFRGTDGKTALHYAAVNSNKAILELLLANKANVNATDNYGRTPLDYLKQYTSAPRAIPPRPVAFPVAPPSIPAMPGTIPGASTPAPARSPQSELAELLRQAGAMEWAPRPGQITVTRRNDTTAFAAVTQGTNQFNYYTLYEVVALAYQDAKTLPFPDLSRVMVTRLDPKTGGITDIPIDLATTVATGDCSKDPILRMGDLVDFPEREHKLNEEWFGLPNDFTKALAKCLERSVTIKVKDQIKTFTLKPEMSAGRKVTVMPPTGMVSDSSGTSFVADYRIIGMKFRLSEVLQNSGLLLTSSDLSRVRVQRRKLIEPNTGMLLPIGLGSHVFDVSKPVPTKDDLWLRDGDVIEVPEK